MVSPIYFFTRGGCIWSDKMQPTIKKINQTLIKEQKMYTMKGLRQFYKNKNEKFLKDKSKHHWTADFKF